MRGWTKSGFDPWNNRWMGGPTSGETVQRRVKEAEQKSSMRVGHRWNNWGEEQEGKNSPEVEMEKREGAFRGGT